METDKEMKSSKEMETNKETNKKEFPEESEVLMGTVSKIIGPSVFVKLEDYGKEGVIPFSEIAPGRIRNIRDYVRPGKCIVCKVLRIDVGKGHIDLSLRRVSTREKKEVMEMRKRKKEAEVLLQITVKDEKRLEQILESVRETSSFTNLMIGLHELNQEEKIKELKKAGLTKEEASVFAKLVAEKIKQKFVSIKADILVSSTAKGGVKKIKELLTIPNVNIKYISAPKYLIKITDKSYKEANKKLKEITETLQAKAKKLECSFELKLKK